MRKFTKLAIAVAMMSAVSAAAQTTLPLLGSSNFAFVGKFAASNNDPGGTCNTFNYGGYGISFYKNGSSQKTLFMAANDQAFSCVGQILIPSDANLKSNATPWGSLFVATTLQVPKDIAPGFAGFDPGNGNPDWMLGTLVVGGRLLLAGSNSYSFDQTLSVGSWDAPDNLAGSSGNFHTFRATSGTTAPPRAVGGNIFLIPTAWQTLFGSATLFGGCCISVISTTSFGPALSILNPANVGVSNPVPGTTVLNYPGPGPHTICRTTNCEAEQQFVFNLTTRQLGGGFMPGTRSVFFVMGTGVGPYCYGTAIECGDPVMEDVKGPHAQPYRYQIIAYDANDLLAVKNGTKQEWEPLPYNYASPWVLNEISGNYSTGGNGDDPRGHAAALDHETGRLYIRTLDGNQPTIYVYQVTAPASGTTYLPFRH